MSRPNKRNKPLLCDECHTFHFSLVRFRKEWLCPDCLNTDTHIPKYLEMSNQVYKDGALSWVN